MNWGKPQAMFCPLLSSVPVTSFYTTRPSGMHLRSSSTSMESCAAHDGSSQLSRNEDLHGETATEVAVNHRNSDYGAADCSDSSGLVETTEESGDNSPSSKEEALKCQSGSELRETPKDKGETAGGSKDGSQTISRGVCLPQPQPLEQGLEVNAMETLSCGDECGTPSTGSGQSKEGVQSLEAIKAKEHHIEDQKLVASVTTHTYLGAIGNGCSQHGTQRVVSESGSFREQSPMKNLNTRSHDGSMAMERTVGCDSSTSDSHSFIRSLASAFSNSESTGTPFECSGDAIEASICCDSLNKILSSQRSPSRLGKGMSSHAILTDTIDDTSHCNRDCETSTTIAHVSQCTAMNQSGLFEDNSQGHGLNVDASEAATPELGESLMSDATDKLTQQDILSMIGGCPPRIAALEEDVLGQHVCAVAASSIQSRRFSDVLHTTPRLAAEASEEDDISQKQVPGVPLLKRSVTLEEATDTILFCSSIIHELVYKSATLAIENEEQKMSKPSVSRRDLIETEKP